MQKPSIHAKTDQWPLIDDSLYKMLLINIGEDLLELFENITGVRIFLDTVYFLFWMQAVSVDRLIVTVFTPFGNANMCLNPLIYASRYEVVKKSWKDLKQKITG